MERGKLRMQKAISRSALVQMMILDATEQLKKGTEELGELVDLGDVEEGRTSDGHRRNEVRQQFLDIATLQKKLQQLDEKLDSIEAGNKKLRRRWVGKLNRCRVEISRAIRAIPFLLLKWKQFAK